LGIETAIGVPLSAHIAEQQEWEAARPDEFEKEKR